MDATRFDRLTRALIVTPSRRGLLRGLAGAALGLASARLPGAADAKKKKPKKPKLNTFGCLDVGKPCGGKDDLCCSGICQGKKPKKGEKDKRKCVAHHTGGCTPARSFCSPSGFSDGKCGPAGAETYCLATTGNAGFCTNLENLSEDNCRDCGKDADCVALGFVLGSACVIVDGAPVCAGAGSCKAEGSSRGTGCFPPGVLGRDQ